MGSGRASEGFGSLQRALQKFQRTLEGLAAASGRHSPSEDSGGNEKV